MNDKRIKKLERILRSLRIKTCDSIPEKCIGKLMIVDDELYLWDGEKYSPVVSDDGVDVNDGILSLSDSDTIVSVEDEEFTANSSSDKNFKLELSENVQEDILKGFLAFGWGNHSEAGYALDADIPEDVNELSDTEGLLNTEGYSGIVELDGKEITIENGLIKNIEDV